MKQNLKSIIKEVLSEMGHGIWDVKDQEIELNGRTYFVNAMYTWELEAIDHRHDPMRGQGQDEMADVVQDVKKIEVFDENSTPVTDPSIIQKLKEMSLDEFVHSGEGIRNRGWDRWA